MADPRSAGVPPAAPRRPASKERMAPDAPRLVEASGAPGAPVDPDVLEASDAPLRLLRDRFGLQDFRPGQRAVIDALLTEHAALAVFPTGGGKSLCYQLPALLLDGVTLVVSPLIALMKDQIDVLRRIGVAAARQDSSLGAAEARAVSDELRAGRLRLLYVAPERFHNERFLQELSRTRIALFAVDEAHCISEWGHNFRPDYLKLAATARRLGAERVLALTATATPAVVRDICAGFGIPDRAAIVTGCYRPNLELHTTPVPAARRDERLVERLRSRPAGPTIVYVTLQKTAERVACQLQTAGFPAEAYHAGMEADQRARVQESWMASDRGIVVATIAFGMGIDKADVRQVYHYNLPKSLESYSQEIGRAGRDGRPSTVELLACPDDVPTLENFAFGDTPTLEAVRGLLAWLLPGPAPTAGGELVLDLYELSNRFDLRPLVLRTALVYLELLGLLEQGTPFYAAYELRPTIPPAELVSQLKGEPAQFAEALWQQMRKGRTWYKLDPDAAAAALGHPRSRVVKAIEYFADRGWAEVRVAEVRHRFRRLVGAVDHDALAAELCGRFARREQQEVARLAQVLSLVTHEGCQVNALTAYFGEVRPAPCGHCTYCRTGRVQQLPPSSGAGSDPGPGAGTGAGAGRGGPLTEQEAAELGQLAQGQPRALGHPRQRARFLCGLSSPALSTARLSRHPLFGRFEQRPFTEVLAGCSPSVRGQEPGAGAAGATQPRGG